MNQRDDRRGGWLWLAVFVVSALLLGAGAWRLLPDHVAQAEGMEVGAAPYTSPTASPPEPPDRSASPSGKAPKAAKQASGWPTREATPEKSSAGQPGLPQQLIIPQLKLKMPIVGTTVDGAGLMALPERPTTIGWYSYGPRPGAAGSAVLAGHVDTRTYGIGPLADLRRLSRGDEIVVRGSKGAQTFTVDSVQRIRKKALPLGEIFARDGSPRLRIVSCGGAYLPARGGYQDNVVVTARPR